MVICRLLEIFIASGSAKAAEPILHLLYQALGAWHQCITRERLPGYLFVDEALLLGQVGEQLVAVEHFDGRLFEILLIARDDGIGFQLQRALVHARALEIRP